MNDFATDDAWQKAMRDRFLAPYYTDHAEGGRYVFLDKGKLSTVLQRRYAVDTLLQGAEGRAVCIEEKIVRWPVDKFQKPKSRGYTAFCLETKSCTNPGHVSDGWMVYGKADYLLYCFVSANGEYLICYLIDFPKLKAWFWAHYQEFSKFHMKTHNRTSGRVVPINDALKAVGETSWRRFIVEAEKEAA